MLSVPRPVWNSGMLVLFEIQNQIFVPIKCTRGLSSQRSSVIIWFEMFDFSRDDGLGVASGGKPNYRMRQWLQTAIEDFAHERSHLAPHEFFEKEFTLVCERAFKASIRCKPFALHYGLFGIDSTEERWLRVYAFLQESLEHCLGTSKWLQPLDVERFMLQQAWGEQSWPDIDVSEC